MPGAGKAEIYFIAGMMFLILLVSGVSVYFFLKTYRKEMRERDSRRSNQKAASDPAKDAD